MKMGSTSWVYPAQDLVGNVERLCGAVEDIELVLFDVEGYGNNLPSRAIVRRLADLADVFGHTYTVHLPQDLLFKGEGRETGGPLEKARRVIERTAELNPWAYVAHLNGDALLSGPGAAGLAEWRGQAGRAVRAVLEWMPEPELLCIENIERWDPEAFAPIVEDFSVSRCVDIGHLWLQGVNPLEHLDRWLGRTRVVHLHGLSVFPAPDPEAAPEGPLDHVSLALIPDEVLDPVARFLTDHFKGVMTLEVFTQEDLESSGRAWKAALERTKAEAGADHPRGPRRKRPRDPLDSISKIRSARGGEECLGARPAPGKGGVRGSLTRIRGTLSVIPHL